MPVPDLAQLSTKRVAQADLAIYAYSHPGNNQSPSSIDHLVSIRQSAPQKVLDIPSLAVGVAREKVEIQIPDDSTSASMVTAEATEFCAASGMREPIVVETVEPLRNELSKRLNAR